MSNGAQYIENIAQLRAQTIEQCIAMQQRTNKRLVFALGTALHLLGIETPKYPRFRCPTSSLQALATSNNERTHIQGVNFVLWQGPINECATYYDRIRHTDPVSTWAMHANRISQEELVVLGDSMMQRTPRFNGVRLEDFHEYVERLNNFDTYANADRQRAIRGIRKMQQALRLMRENTDSPQESRCRIALIRYGLPCPVTNFQLRLRNGKILYLDMAYPDIKVVIEYDGRHHASQWLADSKRREALEDEGWIYIQATAENLMNEIEEQALAQRAADRMNQRLSRPITLCRRMPSGRVHIRIASLTTGSRRILT